MGWKMNVATTAFAVGAIYSGYDFHDDRNAAKLEPTAVAEADEHWGILEPAETDNRAQIVGKNVVRIVTGQQTVFGMVNEQSDDFVRTAELGATAAALVVFRPRSSNRGGVHGGFRGASSSQDMSEIERTIRRHNPSLMASGGRKGSSGIDKAEIAWDVVDFIRDIFNP